jgi:hypothetical protein
MCHGVMDASDENDVPLYSEVLTGRWLRYLQEVARDTWGYHAFPIGDDVVP